MSHRSHRHYRHQHNSTGSFFENLSFTLYSLVLVYLFYFSLQWKLKGNQIFAAWRQSYATIYELFHPILLNKYNTIWFDSILIIIIFFFYRRHYETIIHNSFNRGIYFLTLVIVWVLLILTLIFWIGYLLSVPFVTVYWVA